MWVVMAAAVTRRRDGMCGVHQWAWPKPSKWVKGKLVGCGSFGTVHLAMNKSTGGLFVVKSSNSRAGREALDEEVKILKIVNSSPYIVQCLGTEEEEGKLNVFMEYMAGGSLADVAHKFGGSLDEEVVRVYTREILHGLNHLHLHGIVHCDLKCKNVLLDPQGNVKLADFGCARRANELRKSFGGTPLWMAPEVLRNESVELSADIWSLGCTVIEMATGRPPWANQVSNHISVVLWIAHGDGIPQFPPHFSDEGLDFLSMCLQRDPRKRPTPQQLLSHPFVTPQHHYASSPASVLEVHDFKDSCDVHHDFSLTDTLPSSFTDYSKGIAAVCKAEDSALGSSGNWITVRSG
ncbi:mitogen-activated protein kinase kinase kinase NPK1-like [Vigna unguiculata]|nr:mitogen-activated protein kinase kinase kinase NPK1-like [Vigna unguiculata]